MSEQRSASSLHRRELRRAARASIDKWAKSLDAHRIVPNPIVPGVFNQPNYLTVPELGRMVVLYVSWLPRKKRLWPFVLGALEDLFEAKINAGSNAVVGLVVLNDSDAPQHFDHTMRRLLDETYGFFKTGVVERIALKPEYFLRELSDSFYRSRSKGRYRELWDMERRTSVENLSHYDRRTAKSLLADGPYADWPTTKVVDSLYTRLRNELDPSIQVSRDVPVENIKHWFLGEQGRNVRFFFSYDIGIGGPESTLIKVSRGASSGSPWMKMRSLAGQVRLVKYETNPDGALQRRQYANQSWLAISGSLKGPQHDEERYVRTLVGAGWKVVRADLLNGRKLFRRS